jgi:DNA-binding transcriptional ArsR family regulator
VEISSRSSFGVAIVSGTTCCDFNDFAKAMADETRQRILSLLQAGEMNESDIVAHFDFTQPTISHHLALLRRSNLVSARREGKHVLYRANPACVSECCSEILSRFNIHYREARDHLKG